MVEVSLRQLPNARCHFHPSIVFMKTRYNETTVKRSTRSREVWSVSLFCAIFALGTAPLNAETVAITNANVVDVSGGTILRDMTVLVTDGTITAVQKTAERAISPGVRIVDVGGKFLCPGLWDMHVHWYDEKRLPLFIANGVTGIRQLFGMPLHLQWRTRVEKGELLGPRQYVSSPIVDGSPPRWPTSIGVGNAEDARRAVREIKANGYDSVKSYSRSLPRNRG